MIRNSSSIRSLPARVGASVAAAGILLLSPTPGDVRPTPAGAAPAVAADALAGALNRVTLHDVEGGAARPADWQGEVVVLNFWATWCKPCRKEMPLLDELHSRMAPLGGRVAAVSVDRDAVRVENFLREHALKLPVYVDGPEGLVKTLDLAVLPYTFVLDRSGRVVHAGAVTPDTWDDFVQMIDGLLGDGVPTAAGVKS